MNSIYRLLMFFVFVLVAAPGHAVTTLPAPSGRVILTVDGRIGTTNAPAKAVFDREMLESLAQGTIRTHTPWFEGVRRFEGPLGTALLEAVGAKGTRLVITALNDYSVVVPIEDLKNHGVVFALRLDGEYLRVRDKGPLFLVYPFDDKPDLRNEMIQSRSIWQIKSIRVE